MPEPVLLKINDAAKALGVGRSFLYLAIRRGDLKSVKWGRARRVPTVELNRFVEKLIADQADPDRWPS